MKDLSLHLLDILENPVRAGATAVVVAFDWEEGLLVLTIDDNGPGFPPEVSDDPTDPFRTTRTERPVGLGLPLLRDAAEQTGGSLLLARAPSGGVRVQARFDMRHIDAKPLGDLAGALVTALLSWPGVDLVVRVQGEEVLDTVAVRCELDGVPLHEPAVRQFLERILTEATAPLHAWADSTSEQDWNQGAHPVGGVTPNHVGS
jgi:hypothetical protein